LNERVNEARTQFENISKAAQVAQIERAQFVRGLCTARGLSEKDNFRVDEATGTILMTAKHNPEPPKLEAVPVEGAESPDESSDDSEE